MRKRLEAERIAREARGPDLTSFIWDDLYQVSVPQVASRGIDHLRRNGVVLSGVKEIDDDIMNRWMGSYATINQMVEWYREGVDFRVRNVSDTKTIYVHIQNHITAWCEMLKTGINVGNAPVEDLMLMDEVADKIYSHAKHELKGQRLNTLILQQFHAIQPVSPNNFFNPQALRKLNAVDDDGVKRNANGDVIINGEQEDDLPQRESYGDFFRERLVNFHH